MALPISKLPRRIHLVGVGGDGMSALAHYLADSGFEVSGSDLHASLALTELVDRGMEVAIGHDARHLQNVEALVVSDAIPNTNIEVLEARLRDLPILTRAQCIAFLAREKESIFVAGAHGKSTAGAILTHILRARDASTSFLLGASVPSLEKSRAQWHPGKYLVAEACEAFGNLEPLSPAHVVLTNVDDEHLNHYGSQTRLDRAFMRLLERTSPGGCIVFNGDDSGVARVLSSTSQKSFKDSDISFISVGFKEHNQAQIVNYQWHASYAQFDLLLEKQALLHVKLSMPGTHNAVNVALAAVMAYRLGMSVDALQNALASFSGLERRWQDYGSINGIHLIDDYAHHPAELNALFNSTTQVLDSQTRKVLIYQPQLISRTKRVLAKTAQSLAQWDEILLLEIDPAGESNPDHLSSAELGDQIIQLGGSVKFFEDVNDIINRFDRYVGAGDAVVIAGAGQIRSLAIALKGKLLNLPAQTGLIEAENALVQQKINSNKSSDWLAAMAQRLREYGNRIQWHWVHRYSSEFVRDLYQWQLHHHPDQLVLVSPHYRLTYRQLDIYANRLAQQLRDSGLRSGDVVGVHLGSSATLVASLLALAKLGAVYLPLDIKLPASRVAKLLSLANARFLVSTNNADSFADLLGSICLIQVEISKQLEPLLEDQAGIPPLSLAKLQSTDLAYICFTSGTTSTPKGVPITQGSLHNLVKQLLGHIPFSRTSRILINTGIGFDVSLAELWLGLVGGGLMVVTDEDHTLVGPRLGDFMEEMAVTHLAATPSILRTIPLKPFPNLHYVVLAGEVCTPDLVNQWSSATRLIFNAYGPTEATIYTSIACCKPNQEATIGKPLKGINAYIVDEQNQELTAGIAGELLIGGKGVSPGYLSGANIERPIFFAWLKQGNPVDWVYRTGDLAMKNAKGDLIYLGRRDTQIKLNGVRIELEEIEATLRLQPGVADAVVVLDASEQQAQLVAFILPHPEKIVDTTLLQSSLAQLLPSAMVPAQFIVVQEIPITLNGKIDRKGLLNQRRSLTVVRPFFDAGRSEIEKDLVRIWEYVLQYEPIGIYDEFLTLGGDSLKTLLLQDEIESAFETELPPGFLGDLRNITNLAVKLTEWIGAGVPNDQDLDSKQGKSRIYQEIYQATSSWQGKRHFQDGLIVSFGEPAASYNLFVCLQSEEELIQLHEALGSEYRIHGMRSGHLVMTYTPENIAHLASLYFDEFKKMAPFENVIIAGICQGGTIAHTLAMYFYQENQFAAPLVLIEQARYPKYPGLTHFFYSAQSFLNPVNKFHGDLSRLDEIYQDRYTFDVVPGDHGSITRKPFVHEFTQKLNDRIGGAMHMHSAESTTAPSIIIP